MRGAVFGHINALLTVETMPDPEPASGEASSKFSGAAMWL